MFVFVPFKRLIARWIHFQVLPSICTIHPNWHLTILPHCFSGEVKAYNLPAQIKIFSEALKIVNNFILFMLQKWKKNSHWLIKAGNVHFLKILTEDEWKESQAPALQHQEGIKGRNIKNAERCWIALWLKNNLTWSTPAFFFVALSMTLNMRKRNVCLWMFKLLNSDYSKWEAHLCTHWKAEAQMFCGFRGKT